MIARPFRLPLLALALLPIFAAAGGCLRRTYVPEQATRPYPAELERVGVVDVQVFRENERLEIVNSTAQSYRDVVVWINQRYARALPELRAGDTARFSLWNFYDERGEAFNAGGMFRTEEPTPVRLVELELPDGAGRVGLITIRAE